MNITLNPLVDAYLIDGCMRCKYGATPQCKVHQWRSELDALRQIALASGLTEEVKWGAPVYTHEGRNVLSVSALKDFALMGFFKGALMSDPHSILSRQGSIQAGRIVKFTSADEVHERSDVLANYIQEAIVIEKSGARVEMVKNPEPIPDELLQAFEDDPAFEAAFFALTPGRQRGYIIHFGKPKQVRTRLEHIASCKAQIFNGVGLHDHYKSKS
jgi:uncharacterized protein YdeI (YjbR/CyaY-like superfamily)